MSCRRYVFTLNNYTAGEELEVQAIDATYIVYGREVGESGTPHLQGFVYFKNKKAFNVVRKLIPRAHIEKAVTLSEAIEYCLKGGDYWEKGVRPKSDAQRGTDEKERWKRARECAVIGDLEAIDDDIYIRYYSTLKKIKADHQKVPESQDEMDFWWYYGESGTGKSKTARLENPEHYLKMPNKWWDGYVDQPCVIIDEWSPNHEVLADHLKRWCDHHAFPAETKGGTICIRPKKIIITSNYDIVECFGKIADIDPLRRRFKIRKFPEE